jgi:hypothetical protein
MTISPDSTDHPAHPLFASAALHSVASGTARPLAEALAISRPRVPEPEAVRVATAALRSQGLSPLAASLPDLDLLPPELREFLSRQLEAERGATATLVRILAESVAALRANGCEAVLTGEIAVALTAYREAALRPAHTLRLLLVRSGDARRARRALVPRPPVSVHSRLVYRILGTAVDLTDLILDDPVVRMIDGVRVLFASPSALATQLLCTAAAEFARDGFHGVLAIDLRLLALAGGPLSPDASVTSRRGAASLIYVVDAVERFCPGTFEPSFASRLAETVPAERRELGRKVPPLRFTRSSGSSVLPANLLESRFKRLYFLIRRPGLVE